MFSDKPNIPLQEGWSRIYKDGIQVIENYLVKREVRYDPIVNADGSTRIQLFTNQEHANLYSIVYDMATQKESYAAELYQKYTQAVVSFLKKHVKPLVSREQFDSDHDFLSVVAAKWKDHCMYIECLHRIFLYLDRYYVQLACVEKLEKCGLKAWVDNIYVPISASLAAAILNRMETDRVEACARPLTGGQVYVPAIDADLMKSVVDMIESLKDHTPVFEHELQGQIVDATRVLYTQMSSAWTSTLTLAEYLQKVERALNDEQTRCSTYFFASENITIQKALLDCLLANPAEQLLNMPTAIPHLLQTDAAEDVSRAFRLFGKCPEGLVPVATSFREFVTEQGMTIVVAKSQAITALNKPVCKSHANLSSQPEIANLKFVHDLINLHEKYRRYIDEVFQRDFMFGRALKQAFEKFINADVGGYSMAAFLSTYADKLIRRPANQSIPLPATQDALEAEIRRLVGLFSYLQEKDLFAEIYRQQLARRLIGAQGLPHEAEKYLVARLKEECGNSFSCKLEGMLADSIEATDKREEFLEHLRVEPLSRPLEFSAQVLTTGHWPSYQVTPLKLPPVVEEGIERYRRWYDAHKGSRKLTWINSLAQAIVTARLVRVHELVCSGFQAVVLVAFDGTRDLKVSDVTALTELPEGLLKKQMRCLYTKYPIILRIDAPEGGEPKYRVNREFTCPARRFKLPAPLQEDTQQKDTIEQDRTQAIEAAIVRVMKARKMLGHAQLMAEVMAHLRLFKPQPKDIKRCIESLISRDFLLRGEEEGQADMYTYLA